MKKNLNYILTFLLLSIVMSCGKDDIPPTVEPIEKKDISFLLDVKDLTNKIVDDNKTLSKAENQKVIDDAISVIVTIQDTSNNILYNRKKLTINATGNAYVSSPLSLDFGTYTVTEFIVLDASDNAIFLSPKYGSLLASNVTNTVPFSIIVGASSNDEIGMEVLSSFNLSVEDFGYTDLDFTTVGEFTFVIDQTNELTSIIMNVDTYTDQYEYIIDWGDETQDLYIAVSDLIHNYSEKGIYTVTVKGNVKALKSVMINNKGLVDVDFSTLESLERILLIESQLTSLDVSSNKLLEELNLLSSYNQLTNIDLSSNIHLKHLYLNNNKLSDIDISANTQLESLVIYSNQLTTIDLSNNLKLETLSLGNNPQLLSLDIASHSKLKNLALGGMSQLNLNNLDLSIYPELEILSLNNNGLTELDLSKIEKLKRLYLYGNQLTNIDLSTNTELEYLNLDDNELTNIDLSLNGKLIDLSMASNPLEALYLSDNTMLKYIFIPHNQISDIAIMEDIYSKVLKNAKTNNIIGGLLYTYKNNDGDVESQVIIDAAYELTNDFKWNVLY